MLFAQLAEDPLEKCESAVNAASWIHRKGRYRRERIPLIQGPVSKENSCEDFERQQTQLEGFPTQQDMLVTSPRQPAR
jgi:hypothetical protein